MLFQALIVLLLAVAIQSFVIEPRIARLSTRRNLFGSPNTPEPKKPANNAGGGIFGNAGNMMDQLKKAQEMAKGMESLSKELADSVVTGKEQSTWYPRVDDQVIIIIMRMIHPSALC
jgi:hypothetical protein